jgi:amino acid transporter
MIGYWQNHEHSAASETQNPRRNVAKAVRRVFWRIVIFYVSTLQVQSFTIFSPKDQVLGILMIGMLVAYNDSSLLQGMFLPN